VGDAVLSVRGVTFELSVFVESFRAKPHVAARTLHVAESFEEKARR
jgi:hypothetical protein